MILYHAITSYHLLNAITLSMSVNKSQESILLIPSWMPEKYQNYEDLHEFFTQIITVEISYIDTHSLRETESYYSKILWNFEQYDSIYVWGAHYSIGVFLAEKKIPFIYGEEGCGMLSRSKVLERICIDLGQPNIEHKMELGLFDGTCNCNHILCNLSAQIGTIPKYEKAINFDVVEQLKMLPDDTRGRIISFFLSNQMFHIPPNASLLLTQHFANLNMLSFEEQALIYQLFVDYFLEDRQLVIKPHPDDLMYYRQLFPEAQVIREKFPSEFMPFLLDHQPSCVATISSTAIYSLRGHYPEILELDNRYERDYPMTHRYFAAVRAAQALGHAVVCMGTNEILVQRLMDTLDGDKPNLIEKQTEDPCTLLIDNLTDQDEEGRAQVCQLLEDLDPGSAVIFINSQGDYCWYDYFYKELWENITPIILKKQVMPPQSRDFYTDISTEIIYLYSKDKEVRQMVQDLKIEKALPHTGIVLEQESVSETQEQIKILEGILAATERRLLYYIEKEKGKGE